MATNTTILTIRNILKRDVGVYKDYSNKPVAFCFDIWQDAYINKTGTRGKILEINGVPITEIMTYNMFSPDIEYTGSNNPGYDRIKLETVGRYSIYNNWYIVEPQYDFENPAPYMGIYKYLKIISSYPGTNPITGDDLLEGEIFVDDCLKAVVFGFIDETGTAKNIQGTCANNITLKCLNGYIPIKLTGCRLDVNPTRLDCSPSSINFDFTSWNDRVGWSGLILGDIPVSK